MSINFKTRELANEFIKKIAVSKIESFSPGKFAKYAELSIDEAFNFLMEYVKTEELIIVWELRCPNCNKKLSINEVNNYEEYVCSFCQEEFDITQNDLYPKFKISPEYKKHIYEKK